MHHLRSGALASSRLRALWALVVLSLLAAACSTDEESRDWYVNELQRTSSFEASEARCYVNGVADEFGVHALNPSRALPVDDRVRVVEIQNECRNEPVPRSLAFADEDDPSAEPREISVTDDELGESEAVLPDVNYNRRKNVIRRLRNRLGLSLWDASCLVDTLMAETDRQIVTWAAAPPELQNRVLATCLKANHDG